MYLDKAIFINRAPFDRMELNFADKEVNVLTAINGKGKTTILSHIVDAFHEMAREPFSNTFEGKENKYYRISSGIFNVDNSKYSIVYLRFIDDDKTIDYIDCNGSLTKEDYDNEITLDNKISYDRISSSLTHRKLAKAHSFQNEEEVINVFGNNIITYFPSYRFETPGYLNNPYKPDTHFSTEVTFERTLPNPIEIISDLGSITNWIMDVVLDLYVNNHQDKESYLLRSINKILQETLSAKKYKGTVRFGIGKRNNGAQRISIELIDTPHGHIPPPQKTITPSVYNLSAGETTLLCLFGEILRQGDKLSQSNRQIEMQYFKGIVLIDEVDKHLHITLQKEILPRLFALYPNVQFIVSSHSPFLNMGLAESLPKKARIIDLDNNGLTYTPETNEEYLEVYKMMICENTRFIEKCKILENKLKETTKPLLLTEGRTDIMHLRSAANALGIDIDSIISFDETCYTPGGCTELQKILDGIGKLSHSNIVIGLLDADVTISKKNPVDDKGVYNFGYNTYAFKLKIPQSRIDNGQNQIAIEQLYSDEEITTSFKTPNGNVRLYLSTEFSPITRRHKQNKHETVVTNRNLERISIMERTGGQGVYGANEVNLLASKVEFAEAVNQGKIHISNNSWENFRHIFTTIEAIIEKTHRS